MLSHSLLLRVALVVAVLGGASTRASASQPPTATSPPAAPPTDAQPTDAQPTGAPPTETVPPTQPAQPAQGGGPILDLPPEEPKSTPPPASPPASTSPTPLPKILHPLTATKAADPTIDSERAYASDLGTGRRIPIGAYGETQLLLLPKETQLTLRRLVLFFGYRFADWAAVYSEMEVERLSNFEIEQSYLELTPFKSGRLGFRVGLILIPMGIVNLYHEPPTFHGVDRPAVDQLIIPTTWRELGAGIFGTITSGLHYQLDVIAGADGAKFSAANSFGSGISRGFQVNTENAAVAGRINYNGLPGFDLAAAFYYGSANNKTEGLDGIRVGIVEADARFSRWGLMLRAEFARIFITGADKLTEHLRNASSPSASAIGSAAQGFYAEAGYDLLHMLHRTDQQVIVFGRYENVNTRASLPDVADPNPTPGLQYITAGLTYRPRLELAFKFDYRRLLDGDDGTFGRDRFSFGVGFMY